YNFPLIVFINSSISCFLIVTTSNCFKEGNTCFNISHPVIFIIASISFSLSLFLFILFLILK
ncbi:MAG: hypothetical protein QXX03_03520, partial [Nitrososphaerota archaeon]